MVKNKRKPTLPPQGDTGPDTEAQRALAIIRTVVEKNGTRWQQKFNDCVISRMAQPNGSRAAMITPLHAAAGIQFLEAWLGTQLSGSPAWTRDYVQTSPNYGSVDAARLDAMAKWSRIRSLIPKDTRNLVDRVCCGETTITRIAHGDNRRIGRLKSRLRRGLGVLAKELGIW